LSADSQPGAYNLIMSWLVRVDQQVTAGQDAGRSALVQPPLAVWSKIQLETATPAECLSCLRSRGFGLKLFPLLSRVEPRQTEIWGAIQVVGSVKDSLTITCLIVSSKIRFIPLSPSGCQPAISVCRRGKSIRFPAPERDFARAKHSYFNASFACSGPLPRLRYEGKYREGVETPSV